MKTALPWVLVLAFGFVALQGTCAQRALEAAEEEIDSLRTAELAARTAAAGWEAQLVQATDQLERELRESLGREALLVDEKAELARELETLGGQLIAVMDMYADARGQIVARAEVHGGGQEYSDEYLTPPPDSITAPLDDGLLSGRVAYFPAPRRFDLEYSVHIGLTAAVSEAPDGRGLVTLMPERPDLVTLTYGETLFQRPEPIRVCSFGQQAKAGLIGAAGSEALQFLISALTPSQE